MPRSILTPQSTDFPRWYQEVVAKAELAENGPVRGTMIMRPWGYGIWELMQADMNARIKRTGAQNVYFPLFIPESYMTRESEHLDGFSPELAVVTHAGGKKLEEPVVVRPTSETIVGESMAKWIQSYRDLPLRLNQWVNVVRWEMRPRTFLRTTEFLWQEGHSAHATEQEATEYTLHIHRDVYVRFLEDTLAIPTVLGRKTAKERFAGAINTWTLEGMMADGKALQLATSHELGQNFSRAFGIEYLASNGERLPAWTTSWGTSTRMIGGLIMTHGDDHGLRVPPRVAPIQCRILPIGNEPDVLAAAQRLRLALEDQGVRADVDHQVQAPFGRRVVDAELKGIPYRVEMGPRDLTNGSATIARRTSREKSSIALAGVVPHVSVGLVSDHDQLLKEATERRDSRISDVTSEDEAREACTTGWARLPWRLLGPEGEARLAQHAVTVRCLVKADGSTPTNDTDDDLIAVLGRSY